MEQTVGNPQIQNVAEVRKAINMISTGRALLARSFGTLTNEQFDVLVEVINVGGGSAIEDVALPEMQDTAPTVSNVDRVGIGRRPQLIDGKRPPLTHAIGVILREKGEPMNADQVFEALKGKNWLPTKAKNPRHTVGHTLSINKDLFPRAARGLYTLAKGVQIPALVEPKTEASSEPASTSAPTPTAEPKKKATKAKAKKAPDATPQAIEVLQRTRKPITVPDIVKAGKIQNYKQVNFLMMNLARVGAVKKLSKKSEDGKALWVVNREAFNDFVKRYNESQN